MSAFEDRLRAIERDRSHGAAQLARAGVEALASLADERDRVTLEALRHAARRLRDSRPSMAAPGNWAARFYALMQREGDVLNAVSLRRLGRVLLEEHARVHQHLSQHAVERLADCRTVATLSRSTTVLSILKGLPVLERATVLESRPGLEGRQLAQTLDKSGVAVRLITDAQAGLFVGAVDAVLVGADTIGRDGTFLNKTGTRWLCTAAAEEGVPVYVLADTRKIHPAWTGDEVALEEQEPSAIWEAHPDWCRNVAFEPTREALVAAHLTERGPLDRAGIAAEAARLGGPWRALD